jgi:hypothetical protein
MLDPPDPGKYKFFFTNLRMMLGFIFAKCLQSWEIFARENEFSEKLKKYLTH